MSKLLSFLAMAFVLVLAACSKSKSDAFQEDSDNCSTAFVSEYNATVQAAAGSVDAFEARVNAFESRYGDVTCMASLQAKNYQSYSYNESPTSISVKSYVSDWRAAIKKARETRQARIDAEAKIKLGYPGTQAAYEGLNQACSEKFVTDYNGLNAQMLEAAKKRDVVVMQELLKAFQEKYRDVECALMLKSATEPLAPAKSSTLNVNKEIKQRQERLEHIIKEHSFSADLVPSLETEAAAI